MTAREKYICCFLFLFVCCSVNAFNVSTIPDKLKNNAYGVVRSYSKEFDCKTEKTGTEKTNTAITVLNNQGKGLGDFVCYTDQFRELKSFSGKLYDANGNLLRKFKISDLQRTEYSESLATGGKIYYFSYTSPVFPYTLQYEYEVEWKNGIFVFPAFYPQAGYNLSVEKAGYTLKVPRDMKVRYKTGNFQGDPVISNQNDRYHYTWHLSDLNAVEHEPFSLPSRELVPWVYVSPEKFQYGGISGFINDWQSYGAWLNELMAGRGVLPEQLKAKITELTQDVDSDIEKVRILYDYLGETTRYVSIQLGIGGYQPMTVAEVYKTGFGDCKALTFYLKSMLDYIGVPANYCVIRLDEYTKTILHDYPSFQELNHVILQVPLADTLWLECTNTAVPFGFVHNGISGHDVIVLTNSGGVLMRTPDYADSLNVEENVATVVLNQEGMAQVSARRNYEMKMYDDNSHIVLLKKNEQTDKVRRTIYLPNVSVKDVEVSETNSAAPSVNIAYNWEASYGNKTGNRLFLPVNPYQSPYKWFNNVRRKNDIYICSGFKNADNLRIKIPEGYEVESMPASEKINTPFGTFESIIEMNDSDIIIKQSFLFVSGTYNATSYPDIQTFFSAVNMAYGKKIVLRKNYSNY